MTSRSSQACWTFLPTGVAPMASMVVIECPTAAVTGITQDRLGMPSRCTVQAPQSATPQPNLVPFMPSRSRKTHSSGMSDDASTTCDFPLIFSVTMTIPPQSWRLPPHGEDDAEPRLAGHHPGVRVHGTGERRGLDHGGDTAQLA